MAPTSGALSTTSRATQQLAYDWDTAGNLVSRQDLRQGLTETFTYDALDRLTGASGPGGLSLTLAFDAIGNLSSRSDVGSYTYHATRRHAVIAAGSNSYAYDANGNLTTRNGASVSWTSYNLPATLNAGGYSAQFSYAPDRARWRQVSSYATGSETTIYAGGLLEKLTTPVRTHWKHVIATPAGQVQRLRRSDGTSETLYLAADQLGSVEAVLDAAGVVRARLSFAAYGARRGSGWTGAPSPAEWQAIADTTRRGYGGHEMLDNVLLIHMNGRVYDPAIGRFLAADPFVDDVENTQGWNRYGYVKNNPLSFTDPSGYHELPTTQIRPDDPVRGLENIVVTASRLDQFFASMADIASEFAVVPAREPGRIEGGGGAPGGAQRQPPSQQKKGKTKCEGVDGPSLTLTSHIGAYAMAAAAFPILGAKTRFEGEINLFSYNTPTMGNPYWARGAEASVQIGRVRVGFSWEQQSHDGGFSFHSLPTNFMLGDLRGSSDGLQFAVSPPQAGAGFSVAVDNLLGLLPVSDTPQCP